MTLWQNSAQSASTILTTVEAWRGSVDSWTEQNTSPAWPCVSANRFGGEIGNQLGFERADLLGQGRSGQVSNACRSEEEDPGNEGWNSYLRDIEVSLYWPARAGRRYFQHRPCLSADAGSMCTPCRRDSSRASERDGAAGGERHWQPDGLRAERARPLPGASRAGHDCGSISISRMSHQTGREPLAFRFHLSRDPDARRQGERQRKGHVLVGQATQALDLPGILQALGINPAVVADRATARAAFAAAMAGNGGSFNIPSVPGASGYASVYTSLSFRTPAILLAGFDLNETHLATEQIDYGDPAVTAEDVVDRESLKAFVTEAGNYFIALVRTGDQAAVSKARIAMRDPNGPWRHGSVYLYVWNLTSNTILFHAGFPDRYELQPLVPIARDAKTGEFILPHLIAAAKSGPEGGFHDYHFDDPADDSDSADIPKVGYARDVRRPDRNGARKYEAGRRHRRLGVLPERCRCGRRAPAFGIVETVLPQVVRTMTASTVDAISGRVERANGGTPPAAALSFGGASTLTDAVDGERAGAGGRHLRSHPAACELVLLRGAQRGGWRGRRPVRKPHALGQRGLPQLLRRHLGDRGLRRQRGERQPRVRYPAERRRAGRHDAGAVDRRSGLHGLLRGDG